MTQRFALDRSYRRPNRGPVVIGGSPLRLFRLGAGGVRVAEALEAGLGNLPTGHDPLTARFTDAGVIHPVPDLVEHDPLVLTVVVPSGGAVPLSIVAAPRCRLIVVDDGADPPMAPIDGAEMVRLDRNAGPGAARNAGLALVTTPFVAFVDTDVDVDESVLLRLLTLLDDPGVALVAPRITAADGLDVLTRFERRHSPLDMGSAPARIAATTRVSYVPAAVLVCRTDALREVGGFDTGLRYGEDVDLVWRLTAAGHRCRYEPRCTARHRTRPSLPSWVTQRFRYGTSAAPLAVRHPVGTLAPMRMSPWSAATWLPVLLGLPVVGALVGAGTAVALARKLRDVPVGESLRLAGLGNLFAGRLVAATLTRAWWPVTVVLALVSRRARVVLALAVVVPAAVDWCVDRPELDPVRYLALRVLDDAAYGAGVWAGAIRTRSAAALLPSFEAWPPSGDRSAG
ncbi:MAG: mycofactocin biosynthesis glycosyltransferase MftF [Ilumatobacteraceae bacterium]